MNDLNLENWKDEDILRLTKALSGSESEVSPFWRFFDNYDEAASIAEKQIEERDYVGEEEKKTITEEEIVDIVKLLIREKSAEYNIDLPDFDTKEKPIITSDDMRQYEENLGHYEHEFYGFIDFIELAFIERGGKVIYSAKDSGSEEDAI